jgi:hypothetical protein
MEKPALELTNSLNWNSAYRQTLQAKSTGVEGEFYPIPKQNFVCPSNLLLIGCSSTKAKDKWWLGARLSVSLSLSGFDSTFDFTGVAEIYRTNIGLKRLKLLQWRAYKPQPYIVTLDIPWWLQNLTVEAWWYDGEVSDNYEQLLQEINRKINAFRTQNPSTFSNVDDSILGL